jgi:pimeloyl-ACP methyl ester carboxylesterase
MKNQSSLPRLSKPWIPLIVISILSIYCRSHYPELLPTATVRSESKTDRIPVVFVPGIKGSVLLNEEGDKLWLTGTQALGLQTPNLGLYGENQDLIPGGPVLRVTAIPYLIEQEIYGPWIQRMMSEPAIDFYVFSYDWRKDNLITQARLVRFLKEIQSKYNQKPVLIGHSMGGMLSFSAANQNPGLVEKAIFVGTPFRGGIGYMEDLLLGNSTGLNKSIQGPCQIAKYESVYGFFPRLKTTDTKDTTLDASGKPLNLDFFSEQTWKDQSWGFYAHSCHPDQIPNPIEFQFKLDRARKFRESLDPKPEFAATKPKLLVVSAKNRPSLRAINRIGNTGPGSLVRWDFQKAELVPGDGRVTYENSLPAPGVNYTYFETDFEHGVLMNDPNLFKKVLAFLEISDKSE